MADTGIWLYGVVRAPDVAPEGDLPAGVDGAEVRLLDAQGLAVVGSTVEVDRPPGRRAELTAHGAVLDALAARGPVVPVRFGTIAVDEESVVADLLEPERDRFEDLLARLDGVQQFRLRVDYHDGQGLAELVRAEPEIQRLRQVTAGLPEGVPHPDLVRLGELVARGMQGKREQDAEGVWDVLEPLVVAHAPREVTEVDAVMDTTFLVAVEKVAELEDALETLAEAVHERLRLRLTGPMPAYDFVGEQAGA
jgi:hypothetical protein